MRVISGSARGLKLISPKDMSIRPTADRIKETLFNIISFDLPEATFLDLFSGTGAIGIEAISRGCIETIFVDKNKESIEIINTNIKKANFEEKSVVINLDVIKAIDFLKNSKKQFDIIFMDPPYEKGLIYLTLKKIISSNILKKSGFIICEQSINEEFENIKELEIFKVKEYKVTKIFFLRYTGEV